MLAQSSFIIVRAALCRVGGAFSTIKMSQLHTTGKSNSSKVAVVLSGCGVYDGTEVHEAAAILVHLSRGEADVDIFAPDVDQMHVVDHTKGQPAEGQTRNVLVESARIARGKISPLSALNASTHDAVLFPGGFGAAKNLSTVATEGANCTVNPDVERVIKDFHKAKKPIGLCCISPTLAAKVIPGCEVTVGHDKDDGGRWPYAGTAGTIEQMGSKHINKNVSIHVDAANKIVTTPAFMCETKLHEIHDGIGKMVTEVLSMAK